MRFTITQEMFLELLWQYHMRGYEDGRDGYPSPDYKDFMEQHEQVIAYMQSQGVPDGDKH